VIHNVRAVTLWSRRSREADKVVGLFTREMGRVTARATSAAKSIAKFAALTEPFVESEIALYLIPGRGWGKIVGGKMIDSFPPLRLQVDRSTSASWICEVVYRLTPEEQASPEKFDLLHEALSALSLTINLGMIRLAFAVRFLAVAGFGLENREPWMALVRERPEWARGLLDIPLQTLGDAEWRDPLITAVEHLAGSVVADHLNRPLHVNRFRQMAGVEI
jgi:Recombination protein O N terminal/Recombination protein O C terminal